MRVFERVIRRADIPIAMSKGFNPHPKLSILLALGVGISGIDEVLELELLQTILAEILIERLNSQLPDGIRILSAEAIPHYQKNPILDVIYEIVFKDENLLKNLDIHNLLQQTSIIATRTKDDCKKTLNIRPFIQKIAIKHTSLTLSIKVTPEGTARPEEVLQALHLNGRKESFEITRTKVNLYSYT